MVLDRDHVILELGGLEVGVVGTKGFVGGFAGAEIPDFGEPALRQIYHETTLEVEALEQGLEAVSGCHKRVVLLHYAPITETIVGEPEAIWAFLGLGPARGPDRHASTRARRPRARAPRRRARRHRHRAGAQRRRARDR